LTAERLCHDGAAKSCGRWTSYQLFQNRAPLSSLTDRSWRIYGQAPRESYRLLTKALAIESDSKKCLLERARISYRLGQHASALQDLNHLHSLDGANYDSYLLEGMVLRKLNQSSRAMKAYEKAIKANPRKALPYGTIANLYLDKNDLEKALFYNSKALSIDSRNPLFLHNRAIVYEKMKKYDMALKDLETAAKILPNYSQLYKEQAAIYFAQGKYNLCLESSRKACRQSPGNPVYAEDCGVALTKLNRYSEAIKAFDQAIKLNPKSARAFSERSNLFLKLGNIKKAIQDLDRAISLNSSAPELFQRRGQLFTLLGEQEQAMQDIARAKTLKTARLSSDSLKGPGKAFLEKTYSFYTDVLKKNPRNSSAIFERACVSFCMAHYDEAHKEFNRFSDMPEAGNKATEQAIVFSACSKLLNGTAKKNLRLRERDKKLLLQNPDSGKITAYLDGKLSSENLIISSKTGKQRTQYNFLIACCELSASRKDNAKKHFNWIVDNGERDMDEYLMSVCELERIGSTPKSKVQKKTERR
ncbi:tetratricopeptide repeat protein, partial [bacterium]|nr:tetratricopeptide repeat protein [bacterium]